MQHVGATLALTTETGGLRPSCFVSHLAKMNRFWPDCTGLRRRNILGVNLHHS